MKNHFNGTNAPWMGSSNQAILIIRVSSLRQSDNTSFTSQLDDAENYVKAFGLTIIKTFKIIESAKDSDMRKQYKAAFAWADQYKVRHRIFDRSDREARNLKDIEENENRVRRNEIVLHYAKEFKAIHVHSSDSDFLARDYSAVNNKHYSRELSGKVRRGMLTKAMNGHYPGSLPPAGYIQQKIRDEHGRELRRGTIVALDPDPRERQRVIRCFELRAEHNWSASVVRKQLMEESLILPHERTRFSRTKIERIWNYDNSGKFYLGYYDWGGLEHQGKHELFVPQDLARQVILGKKRRAYGKIDDGVLGGGWIKCECGCNIVYDPKAKIIKGTGEKRIYRYYHCSNGKKAHPNLKGMAVTEDYLFEEFGKAVESFSITEKFASEIVDALNATKNLASKAIRERSEEFQRILKRLDDKDSKLLDAHLDGVLEKEEYKRQIERVREERRECAQQLEKINLEISDASMETVKSVLELAISAKSLWNEMTPQERREYLDCVLSNRMLDGVSVRFNLYKPFDVISNFKENQNWSGRTVTHPGRLKGPREPK